MAPKTDRRTSITSSVASPVTTDHAEKGSVVGDSDLVLVVSAPIVSETCHDGKGANGSKTRPHDAYPVRCRVPVYYESCSEGVHVCQLKKCRQLKVASSLSISAPIVSDTCNQLQASLLKSTFLKSTVRRAAVDQSSGDATPCRMTGVFFLGIQPRVG